VNAGHEVQSHSLSHPEFTKLSNSAIDKQLTDLISFFDKYCNKAKPTIFRPPYGSITTAQAAYITGKYNYSIGMWNLESKDTYFSSSSSIAPYVKSQIPIYKGQSIISLHHDFSSYKVAGDVIKAYRNAGYSFITMTQCAKQCAPYADSIGVCRTPFGDSLISW
jgi:peptidoglycan/xylan/chitin deacetylase (PgdA/CDA1 family)